MVYCDQIIQNTYHSQENSKIEKMNVICNHHDERDIKQNSMHR